MTKKLYGSTALDTPEFQQLMFDHRMAMTSEDLNTKANIVVELASRDYRIAELETALEFIRAWKLPLVESQGEMVSYSLALGSNGERDYMKNVANKALESVAGEKE